MNDLGLIFIQIIILIEPLTAHTALFGVGDNLFSGLISRVFTHMCHRPRQGVVPGDASSNMSGHSA